MGILSFLTNLIRPSFREETPMVGLSIRTEELLEENQDTIAQDEGLDYYWKMSEEDPMIAAGLRHRDVSYLWVSAEGLEETEDYAAHQPQLLPASDDPQDQEIWEFCTSVIDHGIIRGFRDVLNQTQRSAMVFGYAIEEIIWGEEDGKIIIEDVKDRDPARFEINPQGYPPGIYFKKSIYDDTLIRMPERKFLVHTPNYYLENPYGTSELRSLVNIFYGKKNVKLFWERHLEKWGSGQILGTYPKSKVSSQYADWRNEQLRQLSKLRNQGVALKSDEVEVEILESEGAGESFKDYLTYVDDMISIGLTGNNMSIKSPSVGSYALAEQTTTVTKSENEIADIAVLENTFDIMVQWLVDWNWMGIEMYPKFQIINPQRINPTTPEPKESTDEEEEMTEEKTRGSEEETEEFSEKKTMKLTGSSTMTRLALSSSPMTILHQHSSNAVR